MRPLVSLTFAITVAACTASADDEDSGADSDPATAWTRPLGDLDLCPGIAPRDPPAGGPFTAARDPSPFGTGEIERVVLGALVDPSVVVPAPNPASIDTGRDLDTELYDLFVPATYDGSGPFGLLLFVNAGNNGGIPPEWFGVLEAEHLIGVAGRDIGNAVDVDIRMGKMVLGGHRALELFHVDRSRVFASGRSGGARTAMVASWLQPDLIRGALPMCGASYFAQVEQLYETQEPDAHYEYWGDFFYPDVDGAPFSAWATSDRRPFALVTSFDDFREGDVLNILHGGLDADGFRARLIEGPGGHCATSLVQARDAVAFVDHPWFDVGAAGGLSVAAPGAVAADSTLNPADGARAVWVGRDRVSWRDPGGLVLRVGLEGTAADSLIGLWSYAADLQVATLADPEATHPSVQIRRAGDAVTVTLAGYGGRTEVVSGTLTDAVGPVEVHLWAEELQIDLGGHLATGEAVMAGARVLDDRRTVRLRWAEAGGGWDAGAWEDGAVVAVGAAATGVDAEVRITAFEAHDAIGFACE